MTAEVTVATPGGKQPVVDQLKAGADYTAGLPLKSHAVVDRNLYTGQNPSSSAALARRIVDDVSATSRE
ncbi:hypothetical protein [Amycolatopsis sp. NPDC054798]